TAVRLTDHPEDREIDSVEPEWVDVENGEPFTRDVGGDEAVRSHLGEVAHAVEQSVRDARRPARPAGDLDRPGGLDLDAEQSGGAFDDLRQLVGRVVVESFDETETIAQWSGDHPGPRGRADQRESFEREV